uniref:Uncharacterized protein n=1 Tax=Anopheles coluzzii TaxID=1518534 RepID=A0A8W7PP09_ANOCL
MYDWPDNGNSTERHKADRRPRSDQHGQRTNNNTLSLSGLVNESIATVEGTVTLPTGHGVLEECQNDRKKSKKKKNIHTGVTHKITILVTIIIIIIIIIITIIKLK